MTTTLESPSQPDAGDTSLEAARRLTAELEGMLGKDTLQQRHPEWPEVKLHMYLSPHEQAGDAVGIPGLASDADIIFMEDVSANPGFVEAFQDIANAGPDVTPDTLEERIQKAGMENDFDTPLIKAILGTKKVIATLDLQPGDPITNEQVMGAFEATPPETDNFDEWVTGMAAVGRQAGAIQRQREGLMTDRLEPQLKAILEQKPDLAKQPELNVLVLMGSAHTTLSRDLADQAEVSRHWPEKPYLYTFGNQMLRSYMWDREPDRETVARAVLENIAEMVMGEEIRDTAPYGDYTLYMRDMAGNFSYEDVKQTFGELIQGNDPEAVMHDALSAKGLPDLPADIKDMSARAAVLRQNLHDKAHLPEPEEERLAA